MLLLFDVDGTLLLKATAAHAAAVHEALREVYGIADPRAKTVVIGDTPRDIACARADGVRCIAVATGPYGPDDLAKADVVLRSAHELLDAL